MIKFVIEISLAVLMALPLQAFSAEEAVAGSGDREAQSEAGLRNLAENIRLGRSVLEFAEEYSMFDTQLYGSLPDKSQNQESIRQLNEDIRSTGSRLGQAMNKMDMLISGDRGSPGIDFNETEQEVAAEVKKLESELSDMNGRLEELNNQSMLGGDSELLDGSLWDGQMQFANTIELLEWIERTLAEDDIPDQGE
jgi:hypothetical protein